MSLIVFVADQATKAWALAALAGVPTLPVLPGLFHLTLVRNPGVAFGLFRDHSLPVSIGTVGILLGLLWSTFRRAQAGLPPRFTPLSRDVPPQAGPSSFWMISLGLILGGAFGNLLDRVRVGGVVDFLDFRVWPVFNVADSCITIGAVLMVWDLLRKRGP
ncbi:MAG: signal peptidase II [Candidatus Omnitrophica bacterium]|nr:signal peptidase II [Candidatus Omnitrophota bacterium]